MADICEPKPEKTWKDKIPDLEDIYDYGKYIKIRCKGKVIRYGHIKDDKFISGMPENTEKCLYKSENIKKALKNGRNIYIVEGEKDCNNMIKQGFYCTTAGGVSDWKKEYAKLFKGAKVVILPDNDDVGQELATRIDKNLKNIAFSVRIIKTSQKPKGDVSDYFDEGYTAESLRSKVKEQIPVYADWVVENKDGKPSRINAGILADAVSKSLDYILLTKKGLDVTDFYVYESGVYCKKSKNEFKSFIKSYIPIAFQTDALLNNVANLILASDEKSIDYEDANSDEGIINFKNGLYIIKENKLIQHSKDIMSTIQLDCNYSEKASCKRWIEFVNKLCSDEDDILDEEKKAVLQEWFGLLISNVKVSRTKKCLALYSALGDTGKSKFLDMLNLIIGDDNVAHVPIQNMSDRFAMGNLYGKRLNSVGDQKSDDIEDSSVFKQITGGDLLAVEMKGKTAFQFRFKGGFIFACNGLPMFADDKGGHIFDRFTIIQCERYIKAEERDRELIDKLVKEKDGIARWGIEGLQRLIKNKFNFSNCSSSETAVSEYRSRVDTFYKFIHENYEITRCKTDRIKKTDFETNYKNGAKLMIMLK